MTNQFQRLQDIPASRKQALIDNLETYGFKLQNEEINVMWHSHLTKNLFRAEDSDISWVAASLLSNSLDQSKATEFQVSVIVSRRNSPMTRTHKTYNRLVEGSQAEAFFQFHQFCAVFDGIQR